MKLAERDLELDVVKEFLQKKVVATPERRQAAEFLVSRKLSVRRACWFFGLSRSWLKYLSVEKDDGLANRLMELARAHPRHGVRMLWGMPRAEGQKVNVKRVARPCRKHGLLLKQKRRRKRRGIGTAALSRAERPNQVGRTILWKIGPSRAGSCGS